MKAREKNSNSEFRLIAALAAGFAAATSNLALMPVTLGALTDRVGFPSQYIGYVGSLELAALAIGAFAVTPFVSTIRPRSAVIFGLLVLIVANTICALTHSAVVAVALRGLVGVFEGAVQGIVLAATARTSRPHQTVSTIYTIAAIVLAVMFLAIPPIQSSWASEGILLIGAGLALVALCAAWGLPSAPNRPVVHEETDSQKAGGGFKVEHGLILFVWFLFTFGQMAQWIYAEQIAEHIHISFAATNVIFALSSLAAIVAAMSAGLYGRAGNYTWPVLGSIVVSAACIVAISFARNSFEYGTATIVFWLTLYTASPFFISLAYVIDPSGRVAAMLPAAQAIGSAAGPAAASFAIGATPNYHSLSVVNCAVTLAGVIIISVTRKADRRMAALRHGDRMNTVQHG